MTYLKTLFKDPSEVLDYPVNWGGPSPGPWLVGSDTITAAVSTTDAGMTVNSTTFTGTTTTTWLAGGVAGSDYRVVIHVTTAAGRQGERTILIKCRDR